jgi:hypothetical protein
MAMKKASVGKVLLRWILGVLGTALTAVIVSTLVPYLQRNMWEVWVPGLSGFVNDWATYPVQAWSIPATAAAAFLLTWLFRRIGRKARRAEGLSTYTTDSFGPWHFHWRWSKDRFGRVTIRNLTPICSVHDLALRSNTKELVCPKCSRTFPHLDRQSLDHFRQTISRKAMTKFGVEL